MGVSSFRTEFRQPSFQRNGAGRHRARVKAVLSHPLLISKLCKKDPQRLYKTSTLIKCTSKEDEEINTPFWSPSEGEPVTSDLVKNVKNKQLLGDHSPGEVLNGRYEIQMLMGRGGNGVTYKALDQQTGTVVAIKCLSLRGLADWKQLDLFEREANTLKQLSHPGIPNYLDYFEQDLETDKRFYIVQELAEGKTLAELVNNGWRASEQEAERICVDLLGILQYLASLRPAVVHRDVKPENIVLEGGKTGGRVFLVDFGGVQGVVLEDMGIGSTIVGTYGYMAPEQFRGAAQPASDLYSLGATILFLLSGRPPNAFPQQRLRIAFQELISVNPKMEELLEGLLEPLPEDRITAQDALEIITSMTDSKFGSTSKSAGSMGGRVKKISRRKGQPAGSRAVLKRTATRLEIEVPPARFSGDSVMTGSFALAWNAFVFFWTVSAAASGAIFAALFSIPFWFAGASLLKTSFGSSLTRERLVIGRRNFTISKELALFRNNQPVFDDDQESSKSVQGESRDLVRARLITTVIVNGVPNTAIELQEGVRKYVFGEGLDTIEQEWLVDEINDAIRKVSGKG